MPKLRLYLDTSVISHLFHDDSPERRAVTESFFREGVAPGIYEAYISPYVIDELDRTTDVQLRSALLEIPAKFGLTILSTDDEEIDRLAALYIERGIIPRSKPEDALHVAVATVNELDLLVSWNYRHLANVRKEFLIVAANQECGYRKPLRIVTPLEVSLP